MSFVKDTLLAILIINLISIHLVQSVTPYNVCTFQTDGKLFTLTALNKVSSGSNQRLLFDCFFIKNIFLFLRQDLLLPRHHEFFKERARAAFS